MHPSIPAEAGTFDEASLADAYLAGSPDTFAGVYLLARKVFGDDDTPCPVVSSDEAGDYIEGDGCTDRWGATWHGSMNRLDREGVAEFEDFGPAFDDWRGAADYRLDGTVYWTYPDTADTTDVEVDSEVVLTWLAPGEPTLVFVGGTGRYKASGPLVRSRAGSIGVEDWGTAQVDHGEILTAGAMGCDQAIEGLVSFQGANDAEVELPLGDLCAANPGEPGTPPDCAVWTIGSETGELCLGTRLVLVPTDADPPSG